MDRQNWREMIRENWSKWRQ